MRILVATELPQEAIQRLRELSGSVDYVPQLQPEQLKGQLEGVGILIVGSMRVGRERLAEARTLQLVIHAGDGPGNIAVSEASTQGIFVAHCPDKTATATAELAFALMIALDRQIVANAIASREGKWNRAVLGEALGLSGATLGIIGYNMPARLLAKRALAFDMNVLICADMSTPESADPELEFCTGPGEIAARSDFVCVMSRSDGEPAPLIDQEFLNNMRPAAALIHLGSIGLMDEEAVAESTRLRGLRVAIDSQASEPAGETGRIRSRLCEQPAAICTQHIAQQTHQARRAVADEVVRLCRTFLLSGEVPNCLNLCERSPATWQLALRVRDAVGVMASILDAIRADGVNCEEITSRVFTGAKAAFCTVALQERLSAEALESLRALPDVLHLELRAVV
jgi:D-3-phosphoglycerate dehydrogenase